MITAVIGKGGVGKTTVTSQLLHRLIGAGETPVLAIDADPSSCLGPVLGVPVESTIGDLREGFRDEENKPASMSKSDWLAFGVEEVIEESTGFDLLTMGRLEGPGCYCFVNNLLRDLLGRLTRSYRHVLIDCEAGLEHLSRRTSGRPDRLVCVTNRSRMGAETVRRSLSLFEELHQRLPPQVELVLNGFENEDPRAAEIVSVASADLVASESAAASAGVGGAEISTTTTVGGGGSAKPDTSSGDGVFTRIWTVPLDQAVSAFEASGRSLLELDSSSPALEALSGWEDAV